MLDCRQPRLTHGRCRERNELLEQEWDCGYDLAEKKVGDLNVYRPTRWLILAGAALWLMTACEKDDEEVVPPPNPVTDNGVNILGVWADSNDGNETLAFLPDGSWSWVDEPGRGREWTATASGSWEIEGNTIKLTGVDHYGQGFSTTAMVLSNRRLYITAWIERDSHEEQFVR
ncbi:MAG: hypothetical protein N2255_05210 [Kiritimatiellae bacterium]|nr:hypothetical protein [Kiritimatiellia bacterium]